jgi:hypothetical protein
MSDLTLYFDFASGPGANPGQLAQNVQSGLERLDNIETVEASANPDNTARMTGLEILAAISLAAQVVHHAKDISDDVVAIAENVKKVIEAIKGTISDLKPKDVCIPIDGERKSIFVLTDADYHAIAQDVAGISGFR